MVCIGSVIMLIGLTVIQFATVVQIQTMKTDMARIQHQLGLQQQQQQQPHGRDAVHGRGESSQTAQVSRRGIR